MVRPVIRVPFTEEGTRVHPPSPFDNNKTNSASQQRLMSKVPSLLFDMEDAEEVPSVTDSFEPAESDVARNIHALLDPCTDAEYMLSLHVRIAAEEAAKRGEEHLTVGELADTLRKLGYSVKLRTALGGGWGGACLRNLRHSFVAVTLPPGSAPNNAPAPVILVDPRFREQFEIAHATPRYTRLLSEVPAELVAPADRLAKAVEILCAEMAVAFAATGTPVPPWRQTAAMLSKWQPRRSEDVDVSKTGHNMDAAALNNAIGAAPGVPRGMKMTGGNTVAQKLAMLGVEPARASPISEGFEELESWSLETDEDLPVPGASPRSTDSPNDAVSLSLTPEERNVLMGEPTAQHAQQTGFAWDGAHGPTGAPRRNTWN